MTATLPHVSERDVVRGARVLGDQRGELARAALVHGEALVDQRRVVAERVAVAGQDGLDRHRLRQPQRLQVHDQRARALARRLARAPAERLGDQRVGGDVLDQVVAGEQDGRPPGPRRSCPTGECPGRCRTSKRAPGEGQLAAVVQHVRDRRAAAPAAVGARHRGERGDHVGRDAVAQHQRLGELVVAVGVHVEVLDDGHEHVERADLGAGALGDDPDQPEMVGVLVGDDDPLEVLDPVPVLLQGALRAPRASGRSSGPTSTSVSGSSSIR